MLDDLLDEYAIRKVLELFMRRSDDCDAPGVAELFTPDGVFRVSGQEFVGRQAIADFLLNERQFIRDPPRWQDEGNLMDKPRGIHLISNPIFEIDGDLATSEVDCVTVHRTPDGEPRLGILCRYRDRLTRTADGKWLISDRTGVSVRRREPNEVEFLPSQVRGS